MNSQFTSNARTALSLAKKKATDNGQSYIGTEHILFGLVKEKSSTAAIILSQSGVTEERLESLLNSLIIPAADGEVCFKPEFTVKAMRILENAVHIALQEKQRMAGTIHILMAILRDPECVACKLLHSMHDVNVQKLYLSLMKAAGLSEEQMKNEADEIRTQSAEKQSETPTLDKYSRDLTALARNHKLDPVIGRQQAITRVIEILSRRKKNNPCLIGEPGVGKTAVVEGLAERITTGNVPENMLDKRLVSLDLSAMVAGSKYRGEFEERIKKVIGEVMTDHNILLFIDEIHTIIGAGGAEGALDASNILKPSLARGDIQLIGATTTEEYRKRIEKDAALERRFQPVMIDEPDEEETLQILRELRPLYEEHHGVRIRDDALEAAVRLSTRYIHDRFQPDKAIDLMDEASSSVQLGEFRERPDHGKRSARTSMLSQLSSADAEKNADAIMQSLEESVQKAGRQADTREDLEDRLFEMRSLKEKFLERNDLERASRVQKLQENLEDFLKKNEKSNTRKKQVTADDIAQTVSVWTKIPVAKLKETESRRLARLETILHKRVIGQDEAVTAVSRAIRRGRVGLKDPNRPIGSFLFLGPTGVGKTELSKALAEAVFGSENSMIRVDMSEYMEKHSVSKLIGSPPGYVGYDEGGQLSEKVRRNPYSVILFDEIEKAHPDVFNILLQVLDDGHITDAQGRKVSFKDTIIIMTSNAGASRIIQPKHLGFLSEDDAERDYADMKEQVMDEVRQMFRPEFLNRIDEILVFHALGKQEMKKIVDVLLKGLINRCAEQMQIRLSVTPAAKESLIDKSFDSKYGARPLKRAIQTRIEDPLAEEILNGRIRNGDHITVTCKDDKIIFRPMRSHNKKAD
ncbi:MAG: ATP-dependent Clp protease ATP-binding subunit [Eubacterium sp.]|nr:ATP-dependent Clp protease ATP-binding subunit [Eubacterium sp.]